LKTGVDQIQLEGFVGAHTGFWMFKRRVSSRYAEEVRLFEGIKRRTYAQRRKWLGWQ
jgi:hypothetical protein